MTNRIDHKDCPHEATSSARAACRKARASLEVQVTDLLATFATKDFAWEPDKWVFYAARRFASYKGTDRREAAKAVLAYFLPSGDENRDANRRRNGHTITTDFHTMLSITLRAAS